MTIILGIDPGSRITGYGVIKSDGISHKYLACGSLHVANKLSSCEDCVYDNLSKIFNGITEVISKYTPDEVAIEQVFVNANVNSALKLGQARGVAIVAAAMRNLSVAEYSSRQVKQAVVGFGAATKQQIQHMVKLLLKLTAAPAEDAADALAIAICHANMRRSLLAIKKASRRDL